LTPGRTAILLLRHLLRQNLLLKAAWLLELNS
jgi:hypothetical protein